MGKCVVKKKWVCFALSGIWLLAGVLNARDGKAMLVLWHNFGSAALFAVLGAAQLLLQKKGERGAKIFKRFEIAAFAIAVLAFIAVIALLFV